MVLPRNLSTLSTISAIEAFRAAFASAILVLVMPAHVALLPLKYASINALGDFREIEKLEVIDLRAGKCQTA